tara:strand:+ start:114 stop:776 length:663 start_codon:yes stop_codon:yes gene_type:complete
MITPTLVKNSVLFSLFVQITTGIIQLYGLFLNLAKKDEILKSILALETVVQFIEAVFYMWLAYGLYNLKDVTSRRYYDWMLTTPAMLLATIMYFTYLEKREFTFFDFLKDNKPNILKIFSYNWAMLLFGYLGEIKKITLTTGIPIGFVFFGLSFYEIFTNYVTTPEASKLFYFLFFVWSLYGVAAVLSTNAKNLMYNLLDIVSKNFYGLFIFYKILQVAK